jgi:hypothetical protein
MDQPKRRGTNCLLGGNSKQHVTFGVSCDFENLERTFLACPKCVRVANRYLERGEYASPMAFACRICYSFSLPRLFQLGKYLTPCHSELTVDTPGFELGPPGAFVSLRARSVKLSFHCNRSLRKDGKTWNSDKPI